MTVPASSPEDDALDLLVRRYPNEQAAIATVREAMERLREEWMTDPETGESFRLKPGALLAEIQRLREELDAAKRELREFEHVDGEPLYETAAVAASSFAFARHRAESAEAEVRRLVELVAQTKRHLQQAEKERLALTEGLREARGHLRPEIGGRFDQHAAVDAIDRALLDSSPSDGGGA